MAFKRISAKSRNRHSASFLASTTGFIAIFLTIYIAAFLLQFGAPVSSLWWMRNALYVKEHLAEQSEGGRLIIASGSNGLLGIDSPLLEERTGRPVINLATSSLLGMPYMVYLLEKHVKPGDKIVMPLEADFYQKPIPFYADYVNNIMAWGEAHWQSLTIQEKAWFFFNTSPWRVLEGLRTKLSNSEINPLKTLTREQALNDMNRIWNDKGMGWRGYSYKSVNQNGDILVDAGLSQPESFRAEFEWGRPYYTKIEGRLSDGFLFYYERIQALAAERDAELFLTWSVTTKNRFFDLDKKPRRRKLQKFVDLLQENNIPINCNPIHFHFSPEFFFDTMHHLNAKGAQLRTENLASCMLSEDQSVLTGKIDFESGFAKVQAQEAIARKELGLPAPAQ